MSSNKRSSSKLHQFFLSNIASFCDKCGTAYKQEDLKTITDSPTSAIIQVTCSQCKNMHMAHIVKQLGLANRIPLRIDLKPYELAKFLKMGPISSDNIIDFHKNLNQTENILDIFDPSSKKA